MALITNHNEKDLTLPGQVHCEFETTEIEVGLDLERKKPSHLQIRLMRDGDCIEIGLDREDLERIVKMYNDLVLRL